MKRIAHCISMLLASIVFGLLTPFLIVPLFAHRRVTRWFVAFLFGRSYGDRYDEIIESMGASYGATMDGALARAVEIRGDASPPRVLDCGTGTGFVTAQAASVLPGARFVATDLLPNMLHLARQRCEAEGVDVVHVLGDAFALPLADGSVDLVLAQNTMPCFDEFARVLAPGGILLYVDCSAGWVTGLVRKLVQRRGLFERVEGLRIDMGFAVVAVKGGDAANGDEAAWPALRCPVDRTPLQPKDDARSCSQGHTFPLKDGFLRLLPPA